MTDTIQKIADDMQNWRSLPAWQVDQLHNRLRALSARASAGEGGITAEFVTGYMMAPIGNPDAWPENYANGFNDCAKTCVEQVAHAFAEWNALNTAAPQPAQAGASGGGGGWWEGLGNEVIDGEACILYQHTTTGAQLWCRKSEHEKVDALLKGLTTPASPATGATSLQWYTQGDEMRVSMSEADYRALAAAPQPQAPINPSEIYSKPIGTPARGDGEVWIDRTDLAGIQSGRRCKAVVFAEAFDGDCIPLTTRPTPEAQEARDADTKRLDFLLDNCAVVKTDGSQWRVEYEWLPEGTEGPFAATKRAAIDAALALPAQGEG